MEFKAKWIYAPELDSDVAPLFTKQFAVKKGIKKATLYVTAMGVYNAFLNGKRIGDFIMAPGFTSYQKHHQYQIYDVTEMLQKENEITVNVGRGWYSSNITWISRGDDSKGWKKIPIALLFELHLLYKDGSETIVKSDKSWDVSESQVRFSEIYDGEHYDATFVPKETVKATELKRDNKALVPQEGEIVRECERVACERIFKTPKGEIVADFGQEVTGYPKFSVNSKWGRKIHLLCGEVLDKDGNFYNANYRSAKAEIVYTCSTGEQEYFPKLTFFGFRYLKLDKWPQPFEEIKPEQFTAIAVHSDMKRTGYLESSNPKINRLFKNIIWGQIGNYLDVPTDCPQRDERLGWTGDAQIFCKAASYNFDVDKFFQKWMHDVEADQYKDGRVTYVVPDVLSGVHYFDDEENEKIENASAAWGDVICIAPWQMYQSYNDKEILKDAFPAMKKWVKYITDTTEEENLWIGGKHFGDWLGLDAPVGSYRGSTREDFIASAYYANAVDIVVKTGEVLGKDVEGYRELYGKIVEAFKKKFSKFETQTECVLALYFRLTDGPEKTADQLARMIKKAKRMETGFVGHAYLLQVLTEYGYNDLAYELFTREKFPSWLYAVNKDATTIWEHWDGIMEDGSFWSTNMNSFNHYAYGSVAAWVYENACGITPLEPGFQKVRIAPHPNKKLEWLGAYFESPMGRISSRWQYINGRVRYEITTPVDTEIVIGDTVRQVAKGEYIFWS